MRLGYVKFSGYKRFKSEVTLTLHSKMVALIGPNEAGKTSTLKLLKHISHDRAFLDEEKYLFDGQTLPKLEAVFFLDASDHERIKSREPVIMTVAKANGGKRNFSLDPMIERDKSIRTKTLENTRRCLSNTKLKQAVESSGLNFDTDEMLNQLTDIDDLSENLSEQDLYFFENLSELLEDERLENLPKYIVELPQNIQKLLDSERKTHPNEIAIEELKSLMPSVIEFTPNDRILNTKYNMHHYKSGVKEHKQEPCNAFMNLVSVAELDLSALKSNIDTDNSTQIESQIRNANDKLKDVFSKTWSQANLKIHISWQKPTLELMIEEKDAGSNEYTAVDLRSEGLRQYLALFAFIVKQNMVKPILLIDEAEIHLHYDAQADLIQTLTQKDLASKVIYSTHSIGCLPEDLGNGVKLIIPDNSDETFSTSKIVNKFWNSDSLGFSPILYGMGASTVAFFPTRKAVIVEGQSDPIIMPTLFRQVSNSEFNNFQIVPGLANQSNENTLILALQGRNVVYLVDNDTQGNKYIKELEKAGVDKSLIFKVSSGMSQVITVEDWIDDTVFSEAVGKYKARYYRDKPEFGPNFFDGYGKANKLQLYEKKIRGKISKVDLSYIILESTEENNSKNIFKPELKSAIKTLKGDIEAALIKNNV